MASGFLPRDFPALIAESFATLAGSTAVADGVFEEIVSRLLQSFPNGGDPSIVRPVIDGLVRSGMAGGLNRTPNASDFVATSTEGTARALRDWVEDIVSGEVRLPSPFPDSGVRFFIGRTSGYSTTFHPDKYVATWGITRTIYVNLATGDDTTGNGTSGTPYKTVTKAFAVATAAADTAIEIRVVTGGADVIFHRSTAGGGVDTEFHPSTTVTISGKRIYITPDEKGTRLYVFPAQRGLTWTLTGGQTVTYQATRSNVFNVLDMTSKDAYGIPAAYVKKTSIAEVEATVGSWWTDGTIVYVHTLAESTPVEGTHLVGVQLNGFIAELASGAELFLRNVYFLGRQGVGSTVRNVLGDYSASKFVAWNCVWARANPYFFGGSGSNGLSVESIKSVLIFNSTAPYNSADGFNFHYSRADPAVGAIRNYFALLFNSISFDCGLGSSTDINNAFTSHEGAHIACVGCQGWNTKGPVFANVNGCNSVLIGCTARTSVHSVAGNLQHAAYYVDNTSLPAGVTGAAYLDDCIGDDTSWDLSHDGSPMSITVRRFVGSKMPEATLSNVTFVP